MIQFNDGISYETKRISGQAEFVAGHKRDVLSIVAYMTYEQAKAEFNGQSWSIIDGENINDKSNYQIVASICDNMDDTVTIRIGRQNTMEENLQDEVATTKAEIATLKAENAELSAQVDDLLIEVLEGGTADVSETEAAV